MISAPATARRVLAGAMLTGVATLVAACGTAARPSVAPTVTVTATPTATGSASPTAAPATTPATPVGPAPCPTRSLVAKLGLSQGTAGSVYQVIDFTNISAVTCTLYGYPGVSLAGGTPVTQIGLAATENPKPPRELVTLGSGGTVNALLRIVDIGVYSPSKCGPVQATDLQIFPPNQTTPIYVAYRTMMCSKPLNVLSVSVVQPGSGGSS
jgi:Protein of unknown function (DUF4232)